jgi:hypothetical protein
MKLELTYIEAANLIRRNLNLNPEVTVVIIGVPIVPTDDPVIPSLISDIDRMCWWGNEKIRAIKRFRETVSCGLAEAKWAVENWEEVAAWMKKNSRLPKFEGTYSNGTTRMV